MANLNQENICSEPEPQGDTTPKPGVSGWTRLRQKLDLSNRNSSALERFRDTVLETVKGTNLSKIGDYKFDMGDGNKSISNRVKTMNAAVIGMSMDSDSCTCTNEACSSSSQNIVDSERPSCSCTCSKCFHARPENISKPLPPAQEHFTHIKHASQYMC